jgi:hypothetical protein
MPNDRLTIQANGRIVMVYFLVIENTVAIQIG